MSAEIRAFLRAIATAPDDDLPRLVFADYLDEHGRPERAEFIRAEVEIARTAPGSPNRSRLFERRDKLLKARQKEWFALFDGAVKEHATQRGFITAVHTTPEKFLAHADIWFGTQPITELKLTNVWSDSPLDKKCHAKEIFTSPHLGQLRVLDLHDAGVNAAGIYWLSRNPALTQLRELNLRGNRIGDEGIRTLVTMPGLAELESLDLTACRVSEVGAKSLVDCPHLGRLRELNLGYNRIGDAMQRALQHLFGRAVII